MSAAAKPPNSDASRIELSIPASSEWVRVARLTVAGVASRLPFPVDVIEDIKLAVTEAINNAIQHAPLHPPPGSTATISVVIETAGDGLWINVADQGRLPAALPAASTAAASWPGDLPEGGLGLMLIESLMDEVEHQSGPQCDTVVRMFKRVPPPLQRASASTNRPQIAR